VKRPELAAIDHSQLSQPRLLTGWGHTAPAVSRVVAVDDADDVIRLLSPEHSAKSATDSSPDGVGHGVIARGLGRSYGDAAQCAGGLTIDMSRIDPIGVIDPETGSVEVGGGTSLDALIRTSLPQGWFIAVSPGTRQVTVGGAIAADVHGKNHHRDGSFCSSVTSLTLATPTGIRTVGPESDPELFWATAGGMGLTGVVVKATLRLTRVETAWVTVDTERFADLDDAMSAMEATDHGYRFSVAWVDCSSHRRGAGRTVLTRGDYAPFDSLRPRAGRGALALPRVSRLRVPCSPPGRLVNRHSLRTFNALWFHKSPRRRFGELTPLTSFLHPLDGVADWNRLYGPRGFVQYQFVVPPHHGDVVRQVISMVASSGVASSMAVLKRFGPADPGPLSFPIEGWTLALDFPAGLIGLPALLNRLDELVATHGGRVYLAKDARLRPELLGEMYPRLEDFVEVLRRVDPDGLLRSDLSLRLGIRTTMS
jgi:decaprenylphospho-beta-D-ribofuranose 2-oxidase